MQLLLNIQYKFYNILTKLGMTYLERNKNYLCSEIQGMGINIMELNKIQGNLHLLFTKVISHHFHHIKYNKIRRKLT